MRRRAVSLEIPRIWPPVQFPQVRLMPRPDRQGSGKRRPVFANAARCSGGMPSQGDMRTTELYDFLPWFKGVSAVVFLDLGSLSYCGHCHRDLASIARAVR